MRSALIMNIAVSESVSILATSHFGLSRRVRVSGLESVSASCISGFAF
jgi:hypothetical protein